ncbi:MAG: PASTA domain-containing protein [Actinomycetota bacterium]
MTDLPAAHRDQTTPDPALGRVLGQRYRLLAPLGAGASAKVYLAHDQSLGRRVAVKCLRPGLTDDARFRRRFKAEAMAAARLTHPNLLAVYDWGAEPTPYLVTEVLLGGTLLGVMRRQRLSPSQGLLVALQVAKGLRYAHGLSTVHRDIKPANLLFGEDGRLRIADFGIARAVAEAAWTEPDGVLVGTARYAAPEQALGDSIDGRADVYSLALTVIEATTGRVPLLRDNALGTMMLRQDRDVPRPDELGPLGDVLAMAGRANPAGRPDAGDLGEMLIAVARQLPRPESLALAGPGPDVLDLRPGSDGALNNDGVDQSAPPRRAEAKTTRPRRQRRRFLPDADREGDRAAEAEAEAAAESPLAPEAPEPIDSGPAEIVDAADRGDVADRVDGVDVDVDADRPAPDAGVDNDDDLDAEDRVAAAGPPPADPGVGANADRAATTFVDDEDQAHEVEPEPASSFLGAGPAEAAWIWADDPTDPNLRLKPPSVFDLDEDLEPAPELDLDLDSDVVDLDGPVDHPEMAIEEALILDPDHGLILDDDIGIVDEPVDGSIDEPVEVGIDGTADVADVDVDVDAGHPAEVASDADVDVDADADVTVGGEVDRGRAPFALDLGPSVFDLAPNEGPRPGAADEATLLPSSEVYAFDDEWGPSPSTDRNPTRALRRRPAPQREQLSWEAPLAPTVLPPPAMSVTDAEPEMLQQPLPAPHHGGPTQPGLHDSGPQPMAPAGAPAPMAHRPAIAYDEQERRSRSRVNVPLLILVALGVIALLLVGVALLDRDDPTTDAGADTNAVAGLTVPQLIGETRETAAAAADTNGWNLDVSEQRRDGAEPGIVIAQDPIEGVALERGETLSITIATGPELRAVPLLTGLTVDEAEIALDEVGLRLGTVTSQPHESVPNGVVLGPVDGDVDLRVEPGSAVDLVVSLGPTEIALPSFVGLSQAEAMTQADQLGLRVRQTDRFNDTYQEGFVVDHEPPTGALVGPGEEITIVLSLGPRMVEVPDVVGDTVESATARLSDAGLVVAGTIGSIDAPVRASNPGAGTSVRPGAEIVLETES